MSFLLASIFLVGGLLTPTSPKPVRIRPYTPPVLEAEPELTPSDVRVVEIAPPNGDADAIVLARPAYAAPMVGHVARGSRIAVRGEVPGGARGCRGERYFALEPFGWICSTQTRPTSEPATTEQVLQVTEGATLPFSYVMVVVPEGDTIPMWASLAALRAHEAPERQLSRGDSVAILARVERFEDASYYVSVDAKVMPVKGTMALKELSAWQGVEIAESTHLPFGWVSRPLGAVYDAPGGAKIDSLTRRSRVDILEETKLGKVRWLRIDEGRWVRADHVNEVRSAPRPPSTAGNRQWLDVDLGEQVVVAYIEDKPVYATLISSGREPNHTPSGDYPIWGKVSSITMKSQAYDDLPYYVNHVPWVLFFQAHNALHGAYWHDVFGVTKSHGCANLAPRDARYLFEWLEPKLPAGWTAVRALDLTQAPVAHIYDSSRRRPFFQERNIGPPDKDDEAERVAQAIARRDAQLAETEQAGSGAVASSDQPPTAPIGPVESALAPVSTPAPSMQ
jgi:hypothetical protein